MNILISPTAFKGTLTPTQSARLIARAVKRKFPKAIIDSLPLADGGDGTLDVLYGALGGKKISTRVEGPLGRPVNAVWAKIGRMAVIEMARASGLALVKGKKRIMEATSVGTGQLIRAALDRGCTKIVLGVGGTACAEGGAGALQALGLRYFDPKGRELSAKPKDLVRIARVEWKNFDARVDKAEIRVLCDVTNPLLGRNGSARTFAPQKGATPSQVRILEKMLKRWSALARVDAKNKKGAGAAGALAFGLAGFARAKLTPGTSFIMDALQWRSRARRAKIIFTGEGRLDRTSFQGKVVGEIVKRRGRAKVIVVCGSSALTRSQAKAARIADVVTLKEFL